jgi:hypothetical protein
MCVGMANFKGLIPLQVLELWNLMVHLFIQSFALLFAHVDPYKKQFVTINTTIWDKKMPGS